MLVLSRQLNETIDVTHPDGSRTQFTIVDIQGEKVRVGVTAPKHVVIDRHEVTVSKEREGR
jgi:carbon storage regulator